MKDRSAWRLRIVFGVFSTLFLLVLAKAFQIQVMDKDLLLSKAKKQFFRDRKIYPKRGNIYDRNGNPLAINIQTYSIFVIPKNLVRGSNDLKQLSQIIPSLSYRSMLKKISSRNKFTWIARKIELTKEQLEQLKKLKGIYLENVPKRLYPNHELLAQVLGFVGLDNTGLAGLEYQYDEELKGRPTILKYIIDNKGRPISYTSEELGGGSRDLNLSIDKDLQAVVEKNLKDTVLEFEAIRGGVGVIDANTGEILAMANYPSFDPNDPKDSQAMYRSLPFVSDPFEPGSTFKLLTVASALDHHVAKTDTNYYCERGEFVVDGHTISEAETKKKFEWLSVDEIVKYSSNVGTTKVAFDLTFPRLKKTLIDFGIGSKTGIEVPGESRGIFTDEKNVSSLSLSNISFGQGVATTGIQMLVAYAAIANGGHIIRPTLFKLEKEEEREKRRIFSEETSQSLVQMLIHAVEEGTGENAKIPYFTIAGKTSTAQRADETGKYNGYIPGFIGFPVNVDKKFVIYAYVDRPKDGKAYYGNTVAGPLFNKIAKYMLYKNKEYQKMAYFENFKNEFPTDRVKLTQSSTRYKGEGLTPNFVGLDKKSANILAEKYKLNLEHLGIGVIEKQIPAEGVLMGEKQIIKLFYQAPRYE